MIALREKHSMERDIGSIESMVESAPQVFIMLFLIMSPSRNAIIELLGEKFLVSFCFSWLSAALGLAKFLKTGPCRVLPKGGFMDGFFTCRFLVTFLATTFTLMGKGVIQANLVVGGIYGNNTLTMVRRHLFVLILFVIHNLPPLLLGLLSLSVCLGSNTCRTITHYPALILTPLFTHFTFGSRGSCCNRGVSGQVIMSWRWTGINMILSLSSFVFISFSRKYIYAFMNPTAYENTEDSLVKLADIMLTVPGILFTYILLVMDDCCFTCCNL